MKRGVVRLQVVFFWSRLRLFANQTDVFTIEIDKKIFVLLCKLKHPCGSPMFIRLSHYEKSLAEEDKL